MRRTITTWAVISLLVLAGCSTGDGSAVPDTTSTSAASAAAPVAGAPSEATTAEAGSDATPTAQTAVVVTIGDTSYPAHLNDTQAALALAERLPLTLSFRDYSASMPEKISELDDALPFDQMPAGDDPQPGDIGYWSPDQRLVLYWGDVGQYTGIHVIGAFDDPAALLAVEALTPDSQVTITRAT